VTVEEIAILD